MLLAAVSLGAGCGPLAPATDGAAVVDAAQVSSPPVDLSVPDSSPPDRSIADLAVIDLFAPDLAEETDQASPPVPDLSTIPDWATLPDLSSSPDLSPSPDLAGAWLAHCQDGVKDGFETDVDCGGGACRACAGGKTCKLGLDCLTGVCAKGACSASCSDGAQDGSETDIDCGGSCAPCAVGKLCGAGADCASGVCNGGHCAAPTCADKVRNGGESDVDCGGPCPGCPVGGKCGVGADCASAICARSLCAPATCGDRLEDDGETDIDCGGPCAPCAAGKACLVAADCVDAVCAAGRCVAGTCADGVRNQGESDVDCGGPCSGCGAGRACGAGDDCARSLICNASLCAAAPSCQAIKLGHPAAPDGNYTIDPDGAGPGAPFSAYCDQTQNGGGWMLVTPAMIDGEQNANCTTVLSTDGRGGLIAQIYANAGGCGKPTSSHDQLVLADVIPWTQVRATWTFAGGSSCWSIFGDATDVGEPTNLIPFTAGVDAISAQVRMGGANGDAFDGVDTRCDNQPTNFWHSLNGSAPRSANVVLRRKAQNTLAGLAVGTSCTQYAAGTMSPTWWKLTDVFVR